MFQLKDAKNTRNFEKSLISSPVTYLGKGDLGLLQPLANIGNTFCL